MLPPSLFYNDHHVLSDVIKTEASMSDRKDLRKFLPWLLWVVGLTVIYFLIRAVFQPYASGISINGRMIAERVSEIGLFLGAILAGMGAVEIYFYQIFFRQPRHRQAAIFTRLIQGILAFVSLQMVVAFFDLTDLFRLPRGVVKSFFLLPSSLFSSFKNLFFQIDFDFRIAFWADTTLEHTAS
jgi:membrane-associated PAP2 superfamily phosphatase